MPTADLAHLRALRDRLGAAKGGDPSLDVRITAALAEPGEWSEDDIEYACKDPRRTCDPKPYTSSIDAALALVERVLPGACVEVTVNGTAQDGRKVAQAFIWLDAEDHGEYGECWQAANGSLAILSALLSAQIAELEAASHG